MEAEFEVWMDRWKLVQIWCGSEFMGIGRAVHLDSGRTGVMTLAPPPVELDTLPRWDSALPGMPEVLASGAAVDAFGGNRDALVEGIEGLPSSQLGRFEPTAALTLMAEVVDVVAGWHQAGFAAGSLRPEAIFASDQGGVRLEGVTPRAQPFIEASRTTKTGHAPPFTATYQAPEVLKHQPPSPASDVCSLASVLSFWVTERPAFQGPSLMAQVAAVYTSQRAPWEGPPEWAPALDAALHPDPAARPTLRVWLEMLRTG